MRVRYDRDRWDASQRIPLHRRVYARACRADNVQTRPYLSLPLLTRNA